MSHNDPIVAGTVPFTFSSDGRECVIRDPEPPRHWYNYLWNDLGYCAQVSQIGHGRSSYLDADADMCMINADGARYVYLRDEASGDTWNIGFGPLGVAVDDYACEHGLDSTTLRSIREGIAARWQIIVPDEAYGELWQVELRNTSTRVRRLSLFAATSFSLDGFTHPRYYEAYRTLETVFDVELNGVFCNSSHPFAPHDRYRGFLASSLPVDAFDGDLAAFCGTIGTSTQLDASTTALFQRPRVVVRGEWCTGSETALFVPGAVLQHVIELRPGEQRTVRFMLGVVESLAQARATTVSYLNGDARDADPNELARRRRSRRGALAVRTPDARVNRLMNEWVKKQVDFCLVGKRGVRDNLQIAVAMLAFRPQRAQQEILECLRHQFKDGHALLTWYPVDDTRYSDQPFWIAWAVCRLIKETGDADILTRQVEWQDGGSGTVLEHVHAALDRLLADRGRHGLVKIAYADWNDALNIPAEEEGESVMLTEQLCLALREVRDLMVWLGETGEAARLIGLLEEVRDAVNAAAWDGQWYARALTAHEAIGSRTSQGSKIYLNSQVWAVLADIVPEDRMPELVRSIDSMERDFGFPLNDPPYQAYDPLVGRMSGMLPGLYENGGVYCHASAFKVLADCAIGRGDAALRTLRKIMPDSEWNPSTRSGAEPYVFTNCYATHPKYWGKSYQSWTTGTSAWCMLGLYEGILGVRASFEGLCIDPVLPAEWKTASLTREFRGDTYVIRFKRAARREGVCLLVDGAPYEGAALPVFGDRRSHVVDVVI